MVDMPSVCSNTLRNAGYNVADGTFGFPYPVERSDKPLPISYETCDLPNCDEQEVVFVDLAHPDPIGQPPATMPGRGVEWWWQRAVNGKIDPRPLIMSHASESFERILRHGGIFFIFLASRERADYIKGAQSYGGDLRDAVSYKRTSWSLLNQLELIESEHRRGNEIIFDAKTSLGSLLKTGSVSASFTCVVNPHYSQKRDWTPLAVNKFDEVVGGVLRTGSRGGRIVLLPKMPNVHLILLRLIEDHCAEWSPRLFPDHEGSRWLHRPEYEIPAVKKITHEIARLKSDTEAKTRELHATIEGIRSDNQDWYTLLNGTGDALVAAVIHSLEKIGFQKVIDIDRERRAQGNERNLREDVQVQDQSPCLVVDVKGITGCPEDAEATQSEKHALMRAQETDGKFKPLTIINHQRNIPPHDRQREPYRQEIVENAKQTRLGLMTTWDIFRLLRNKELLEWPSEVVTPVFYRTGRIRPVPEHYTEIGSIVHVWQDQSAFGIIPNVNIFAGSCLAVETGDMYEEIVANSIQVDGAQVSEAVAKSNCGIKFDGLPNRFREGMKVFLVRRPETS